MKFYKLRLFGKKGEFIMDFKEFVRQNQDKIRKLSQEHTKYIDGVPTIARDDSWRSEDEWEQMRKEKRQ